METINIISLALNAITLVMLGSILFMNLLPLGHNSAEMNNS